MKRLIEPIQVFVSGILMGVAAIIPGVSSGTVAVLVRVYDRIIASVDAVISRKPNALKGLVFLLTLYAGNFFALFTVAGLMRRLISDFPIQMGIFFMGLILGSVPIIIRKIQERTDEKVFKASTISAFVLFAAFIIVLNVLTQGGTASRDITELTFVSGILVFLTGIIASATAIIPGVSGSMMQVAIGMYDTFLAIFDLELGFGMVIVFVLGAIFGLIAASKVLFYLLKNFYMVTYFAIIGLLVGSIVQISFQVGLIDILNGQTTVSPSLYVVYLMMLLFGFGLAYGSHLFDKQKAAAKAKKDALEI